MPTLKRTAGFFISVLSFWIVMQTASAADQIRAYLLVETASGKLNSVRDQVGNLSNCKALAESLRSDELIIHVECNDNESLNNAISNSIAGLNGVMKTTVWTMEAQ